MIYLIVAYSCFWFILLVYIFLLRRSSGKVEKEIEVIKAMHDKQKK